MLKINEKFAKKYEEYRQKEELQKFKDKYGDVKLSEARKKLSESDRAVPADCGEGEGDSTSSESEDEDCEGWTPKTEAGFLRVYAALQSGDPRLYDPSVSWFKEESSEESEAEARNSETDGAEHKPMFYNEYHRNYLLKGAYAQDDEATAGSQAAAAGASESTQRDMREAERIRKSLAESHAEKSDSGDSSDGEGALLVKKSRRQRQSNGQNVDSDEADPMARLHRFVSERGDDGEDLGLEAGFREDLTRLKRHWTGAEGRLTESERYLRDYVTKEFWRPPPQPAANGDCEDRLSDDDEAFLARQAEFEAKWNGRWEAGQRDEEFEAAYRRTVASGERLADADDSEDDEQLFVAKPAPAAAAADCSSPSDEAEVQADLRRLERQRQWRLEADDGEEDGGDEAPEAGAEQPGGLRPEVRAYPRRIADSLRQSTSDVARAQRRSERRDRKRAEKLARKRELARLVALKEAEVERRLERLRRNAGVAESARDRLADALGGDFLDAEFDPAEHDRRMARLFGDDGEGEGPARRPVFSDDEDLAEDAEAEAQRLRGQLDQLHAEDLIRAGPGQADLRCRFNYRQVEPNDFGLSAVEVLLADDRELNAWCTVRKASQYRERDADWRDRRRFHSARCQARKDRLMPGMLKRLEAATAYPDAKSWAAAVARMRDHPADHLGDAATPAAEAAEAPAKKRRRKKSKAAAKQQNKDQRTKTGDGGNAEEPDEARLPRCRKRLKLAAAPAPAVEPAANLAEAATTQEQRKKLQLRKQQKKKKGNPGLKISEQRLVELGIDPKKFRRMRRQQRQGKPAAAAAAAAEMEVE